MASFFDTVIAALINMAYLVLLVERAQRRERVFRDRTNPLEIYDDVDLFKKYRFNRAGVMTLIDRLGGQLEHQTRRNHAVPPSLQVFVALRFYATGSVLDNSAVHHGISIATCSRIVRSVTQVLCGMKNQVTKMFINYDPKVLDIMKCQSDTEQSQRLCDCDVNFKNKNFTTF